MTRLRFRTIPAKILVITVALGYARAQSTGTFHLKEYFGVAWPEQPIEFRYDGDRPAGNARMLGPNGSEVPFQWVSSCSDSTALKGCLVVRSALPISADYTWSLTSGRPAALPDNPVVLSQTGGSYELTNGLTGIRLVAPAANPSPWNRAPIQGVRLANGQWTGAGNSPNLLYSEPPGGQAGCAGCSVRTPFYTGTGYQLTILEEGPLKTVIRASYKFNKPRYTAAGTFISAAGEGHYTLTATLYAASKSVLIDEDSDMQFTYFVPLYAQLHPDQARYRGHNSIGGEGVPDTVCGYETPGTVTAATNTSPVVIDAGVSLSNGQRVTIAEIAGNTAANGAFYVKTTGYAKGRFALYLDAALSRPVAGTGEYLDGGFVKPAYRGQGLSPTPDAFQDLTYTGDRPASYVCSPKAYRKLLVNYPPGSQGAGWYAEVYDSAGADDSPLIGFFSGRASQQLGSASGPSMPGIYTSNKHWTTGAIDAGIQIENLLRGPGGKLSPLVHRNWGIFVSTKRDLLPAISHQPIAAEQNSLTGINLSRLYTYTLDYPDPPGGWQWLYLSDAGANQLISQIRNGTSVCGSKNCYYSLLRGSEGSASGQALMTLWQGNSTQAVQAALDTVSAVSRNLVRALAAGDNRFDGPFHYYQLGLQSSPSTVVLNAILMDPNSTAAQRSLAKAQLALFGSLFWDNDWFAVDNDSGDSVGLANQIQQYFQYRTQSATALPSQPFLATKLSQALTYPQNDFSEHFSSTGAGAGSTHYQSAFLQPLVLNYSSLASSGYLSMADPKWSAYAAWELSNLTPPDPRFGNLRKNYSNGDGNTSANVRTGMLGTALRTANPALAGNLMWAWRQQNSPTALTEDSQFVTTLAAIDPSIAAVSPQLASLNVPGYHVAERHGFGTPYETALWFIDGGFYSTGGHRHYDDGQVSAYALSAPLAIDWNANLYSPETPGRFQHNSVVYDAELTHSWNADNPGLSDVSRLLLNPSSTEFGAFTASTTATGTFTSQDGTVWTRSVRTMAFNPAFPVIYVKDDFSGPSAAAGKTLTWNLMAAGPVASPSGSITPVTRYSAGCQQPAGQLPSSGSVISLSSGLQRFTFAGVTWPKHWAGGIDWDLYTRSDSGAGQFELGNWGHGCHSGREAGEFQQNNARIFAETQHILRIHDSGAFSTVILPYAKAQRPLRTVTQEDCGTQIIHGAETLCFNDSASFYGGPGQRIVTAYNERPQNSFGVTVSGGPQEVVISDRQVIWTLSGSAAGTRSLTLPGNWQVDQALVHVGNTYSLRFSGGLQAKPVKVIFTAGGPLDAPSAPARGNGNIPLPGGPARF